MFQMPLDTPVEITTPEDTARAFVNAADKKNELNHKIFNLDGGEKNWILYCDMLAENFKIFGFGKIQPSRKSFRRKKLSLRILRRRRRVGKHRSFSSGYHPNLPAKGKRKRSGPSTVLHPAGSSHREKGFAERIGTVGSIQHQR